MAIRSIPVDTNRCRFVAVDVVPVTEYSEPGGPRSTKQRADKNGVPLWRVNTLMLVDGVTGGETVGVRVAADYAPVLEQLAPVVFENLQARPWEQNQKSGITLSADGIAAPAPARGSRNGHVDKAEQVAA